MKRFLHRAALLTATFALAVTAIGTAVAQVSKPLTVAVLTFTNTSGEGGALLGNSASAAAETQFIGSSKYDVVKRDTVVKTMADLSLTYPLGRTGIQQLATALEADAVITGDVSRIIKDPKNGVVKLTLRMEQTDRSSGELVNGAVVTGESGAHPGFTGSPDVLIDEALNKAAFAAVRSMNERILPEGTVYATSSREGQIEALLNIGSNSGVRQGMEFIILRNREQVGRLQITSVSATDSTAAVIATTRGVQPEDKVRAVFRLENIPADLGGSGASKSTIHRPKLGLGNLFIGAGMLLGISKLAHGPFSQGLSARKASAAASGPYNGAPYPDDFPDVPNVHIKWSPPAGVRQTDILGYEVYRIDRIDGTAHAVGITNGGENSVYDSGRSGDILAMAPFVESKHSGLDAGAPTRYMIRCAYNLTTTTGTGTGTGGTGTTTTTVAYATDVITGAATGLLPPPTQATTLPTDPTALVAVKFNFLQVPGGDRYVIQIADNPQFTNAEIYPKGGDGAAFPPTPSILLMWWGKDTDVQDPADPTKTIKVCVPGGDQSCNSNYDDPRTDTFYGLQPTYCPAKFITVNLLTSRFDFATGVHYWRVGVRNSRDDLLPENGGWVWGGFAQLASTTPLALKSVAGRHMGGGPVRPTQPKQQPTTTDPSTGTMGRAGRGR